jgi:alpha-D-ribose 1-methylphosphonate 5-triphosphate synthase subunit PhnH
MVMDAMARPGRIMPMAARVTAPSPLTPLAAAVALTLLDYETPVWLGQALSETRDVADWYRFHTGAPITSDRRAAAFAFMDGAAAAPFDTFALGTAEYPDRSTTLVLQVGGFSAGQSLSLCGPGIAGAQSVSAAPLPHDFRAQLVANHALFPRGVDVILVSDNAIVALPRSVRVMND